MVFLLLLIAAGTRLSAQTYYEVKYTDKQGYQNEGLMLYYDDEDCTLYLRRHKTNGSNFSFHVWKYVAATPEDEEKDSKKKKDDEDDMDYVIMVCEEDDTPSFIWLPDEDDPETLQALPYISMSEDEEVDDWIQAKSFREVTLRQLSPEYLQRYINRNSDLFRQITQARREALGEDRQQQVNVAQNNNNSESVNQRPVMHLLLVANTDVADIGSACKIDFNNIRNEMNGIAQSLGIAFKEYDVTGNNYSKNGLKAKLNMLNPASNDIVMFLYTGHGFRFDDQRDPYPMMALTSNDYQSLNDNYVALSDVYNAIVQKGARLNIVLSDCCNSKIGEVRPLDGNTLFSRGNNNYSRQRLTDLFFNTRGSLISTAASPGQYSWCDSSGGMFTLSFIQSLRREISALNNAQVSWQSVVDNTIKVALQRSTKNAKAQNGLKSVRISNLTN